MTASSLVKTDLHGNVVSGTSPIDKGGFPIYGSIHRARTDVNCILHLYTVDGIAISAQQAGLMHLSQASLLVCADLAHHDYAGIGDGSGEEHQLVNDLGDFNNMLLRNHGTLSVGNTVADAYARLYEFERACCSQVRALAGGGAIVSIPQPLCDAITPVAGELMAGPVGAAAWPALLKRVAKVHPDFSE